MKMSTNTLENEFLDFGFTPEEFQTIRNGYILTNYSDDVLQAKFRETTGFLVELG